jgi:hypothetical protein
MTFAGHFVEEKDAEMETLDEGNGYDDSGMSGWSIAGWVAVITCLVVLIGAIGYFKKSIE